jgi:hypothetical protein
LKMLLTCSIGRVAMEFIGDTPSPLGVLCKDVIPWDLSRSAA